MQYTREQTMLVTDVLKSDPSVGSFLRPGDIAEGTVLKKSPRKFLVDLGRHGTGVIYRSELQNAGGSVKNLKEGDPIAGKVIAIDNEEGLVELSVSEADKQKAWVEAAELRDKEEIISFKPVKFNRGGLIGDVLGLAGFLPTSQIAPDRIPKNAFEDPQAISTALQGLINAEIKVRVIDVNPRNNKLIVSERAANEISVKELVKNYAVGQVIEGVVSGVADFGVFLKFTDNPQVEGLVHVSELDWREVANPKEVVKIDDVLEAKIIEIKDGKVSLSLKALKADPWESAAENYKEGAEVRGKIYSFNPFGAIVDLGSIQGQIHVTEFGGIPEMRKVLTLGGEHTFTIAEVKPAEKRIALKLRT